MFKLFHVVKNLIKLTYVTNFIINTIYFVIAITFYLFQQTLYSQINYLYAQIKSEIVSG